MSATLNRFQSQIALTWSSRLNLLNLPARQLHFLYQIFSSFIVSYGRLFILAPKGRFLCYQTLELQSQLFLGEWLDLIRSILNIPLKVNFITDVYELFFEATQAYRIIASVSSILSYKNIRKYTF
jgi:hypothetical protein